MAGKRRSRTARRSLVLLLGLVAAVVALGLWFGQRATLAGEAAAGSSPPASPPSGGLPTAPSSPGSVAASSTVGARPVASSAAPGPATGQPVATDRPVVVTTSQVPVAVTYYGWDPAARQVVVGGYADGVIESDGSCTLTLSKSGASDVIVTQKASPNASSTACGALTVPAGRVTPGAWTAVLAYRSPRHAGAAAPVTVQVTS